jgi:hypothetical protein
MPPILIGTWLTISSHHVMIADRYPSLPWQPSSSGSPSTTHLFAFDFQPLAAFQYLESSLDHFQYG